MMRIDIQYLIQHYGYVGIFFALLLEIVGIPFPGEAILMVSGMAMQKGMLLSAPLIFSATLGNLAGSIFSYNIGRYLGRAVILRFGRFLGITEQKLHKGENYFYKYKVALILGAKFILGLRVIISYIAGIGKMPPIAFLLYNSIGSFIWVMVYVFFGQYLELAWSHFVHFFNR